MQITKGVSDLLSRLEKTGATDLDASDTDLNDALLEAERMADQYKHIKPIPYIVPIERAVGRYHANKSKEIT